MEKSSQLITTTTDEFYQKKDDCNNRFCLCFGCIFGLLFISFMNIVKILFQIVEFYLLIIISNIIIGYNIIFICSIINIKALLFFQIIFSCLFCYITANILTIFYFEFSNLSWIKCNQIRNSFRPYLAKEKILEDDSDPIVDYDFILFVILFFFKIYYLLKDSPEIGYMLFIALYPFLKIINIYNVILFNTEIKIKFNKDKFPYIFGESIEINKNSIIYDFKNNSKENILFKKIILIICFIYNIIILIVKKEFIFGYIFIFFIYLFCAPFFLNLNIIPYSHLSEEKKLKSEQKIINLNLNEINRDNDLENDLTNKTIELSNKIEQKNDVSKLLNEKLEKSTQTNINYKHKEFILHRKLEGCKFLVFLIYLIINCLLIYLTYKILFFSNSKSEDTVQGTFNKTNNFTGFHWPENKNKTNQEILSSICYSKINNLNFIQLTSLANAAYLKDEKNYEQNIINALKSSIFNITDNNIDLKNLTFLTNNTDLIQILKTDFQIPNEKPLTIISIKGSTNPFDFLLDAEMFISSAFFSIAKKIPLLFKSETYASFVFNYLCYLPFKLLQKLTLTKSYTSQIEKIFNELIKQKGYGLDERNYAFVGHSLGGSLAKLNGFKYKLKSFSVSGPGFSPLEFYLSSGKNKYDKYFKSTFIDLVPDLDIVPRVEISGGAVYRVLCEKGILSCHQVTRTLCMLGVMCNMEHLTGDLCNGVYSYKEYEEDFIKVKENKY